MRTNLVKKKDTKSPLNDSMLDMVRLQDAVCF